MSTETKKVFKGKVEADVLRSFLIEVYASCGLKKAHADAVVNQTMTASLRGVDTHGVVLTERYVKAIKSGEIKREPQIKVLRRAGATELLDGDFGVGQFLATRATRDAAAGATKYGIGSCSVINMSHCAMLAYYGLMLAERKMTGLLFTNSNAGAAPLGGREKVFGTNPLCFAIPYRKFPIVFDAATTAAAGMKIALARMEGKQIPLGWALDTKGNPTTDPAQASMMLPFGGHKGYALMFMVEVYAAVLSGGQQSLGLMPRDAQGGLYVQAIDIKKIRSYKRFLDDMDRLADAIKGSAAPGGDEVYLPGEIEHITTERRLKEGIPLHTETWESFGRVAGDLNIDAPKLI
jgi:ureidoglycolate dehydrogenase (NAD+)